MKPETNSGEITPNPGTEGPGVEPGAPTKFCSAESYAFVGVDAPSKIMATTSKLGITCMKDSEEVESRGLTEATTFLTSGPLSQTAANKKKCTDLGGTATDMTCGGDNVFQMFLKERREHSLYACCGYPTKFGRLSLPGAKTGGTYMHAKYTDKDCKTVMTGSQFKTYADKMFYANGKVELALGECHDLGYVSGGEAYKWTACNATAHIRESYYDSACATKMSVSIGKQGTCEKEDSEESSGNMTNSAGSSMDECTGGEAPAKMEVVTTGRTVLTGIPTDIAETDKVKVVDTASETYRKAVMKASGDKPTTIESKVGTGNLAPAASRRRLASRRLQVATEVITVTATTVPTADAAAAKASLDTATSTGGALSASVLGAEMTAAIKAEVATLTNITATPAVVVSEPSIPVDDGTGSGGGGSTSSAVAGHLGFGAGLALLASLLM